MINLLATIALLVACAGALLSTHSLAREVRSWPRTYRAPQTIDWPEGWTEISYTRRTT